MNRTYLLMPAVVVSICAVSGEDAPAAARISFYNFSDLIDKAERIVVGEIGESQDGVTSVTVLETLKSPSKLPAAEPELTPDVFKRAQDLLNSEAERQKTGVPRAQPAPAPTSPSTPANSSAPPVKRIEVVPAKGIQLPQRGVQVVFFLWERTDKNTDVPRYALAHPQAVYDPSVASRVRGALGNPRSISDGRYLREWDRRAAERAAERKADEALLQLPPGAPVRGLKLEGVRCVPLVKGDNSFRFATHLTNVFTKEMTVYDGPASSYGVILSPTDAAAGKEFVLHLADVEGTDSATLNITNMTDFESLDGGQSLTHEHVLEATAFPVLKKLSGAWRVRPFYANARDGKKDGVTPAWTGTIVAPPIDIEFKKLEEKSAEAGR